MIVALASPSVATSLDDGLEKVRRLQAEAAAQKAEIVCFPEAYLPGLRGQDFEVPPFDETQQRLALQQVAESGRASGIATIIGMEKQSKAGRQIVAYVIDADGKVLGYQTKNQLDPTEEASYVPGMTRRIFEINGVKFGIAICHEGWRYPETVRWAAVRGAKIVFHPQHTGAEKTGVRMTEWGAADGPYYEKAMMMRSRENTIYFASVNYALKYQESATSLIAPSGECLAYMAYGEEGVLVQEIDVAAATGLLASRFAPGRYDEFNSDSLEGHALAVSLTVKDIHASLAWYTEVLGFSVRQRFDRGGPLRAVSLIAGKTQVLIGQDDGAHGSDRAKGVGFSFQITTAQDIDELAARIKSKGGTLEADPVDTPFGARMFRLHDPDGFKLVISSFVA